MKDSDNIILDKDRFLELFDKRIQESRREGNRNFVDMALWHMLEAHKDKLPKLDDYFHKLF